MCHADSWHGSLTTFFKGTLSMTAEQKIAQSESLSALFSYFKSWSPKDESLKFKSDSVMKETPKEEAA
jgi:hypothetical protein